MTENADWKMLTIPLSLEQYERFKDACTVIQSSPDLTQSQSAALYDMKYLIMDAWIMEDWVSQPPFTLNEVKE